MTWTKYEIQSARKLPLPLILRQNGFTLFELENDNYRLDPYNDFFIKENYWIWKSQNLHGNTIDFFVKVHNLSFSDAMNILCPK